MNDDVYNLQRFAAAQQPVYETVLAELRAGRKQSHWMWFIFPQISGLGHSDMARRYAISSLDEAGAYLQHPILGPRLRECAGLAANIAGRSAHQVFGAPDDLKFRSSMTLFAQADVQDGIFKDCLARYFDGKPDPATLAQLAS